LIVIFLKGNYSIDVVYNFLLNPANTYEYATVSAATFLLPNLTFNWWGSAIESTLRDR